METYQLFRLRIRVRFPGCPFSKFLVLKPLEGNAYTCTEPSQTDLEIHYRLTRLYTLLQWPYGYSVPQSHKFYNELVKHCGKYGTNCYCTTSVQLSENKGKLSPDQWQKIWLQLVNTGGLGIAIATSVVLTGTNYKGANSPKRICNRDDDSPSPTALCGDACEQGFR